MKMTVIKDVRIVDGTGKPSYVGSVVIKENKIREIVIERDIAFESKDLYKIIDGKNKILAPGFIDTHSHSDLAILEKTILEPKIRQGITTEVLGQDGISMAPLPKEYIFDWQRNISGLDGTSQKIDWEYETVKNYFHMLETSGSNSNMAYLVPHGNIRLQVMGFRDDNPTEGEIEQMKQQVEEAMKAGCLGLSTGLIYNPCAFALEEELIELCKVVKSYDGVFVVHQRSEAGQILSSMDEIIRVGMASGVKVHFSHFKICGKRHFKLLDKVLKKLDEAKEKGVQVSFDMYPYTAGSTMLSAIFPPWMHIGGTYDMLKKLNDLAVRKMLKKELKKNHTKWDNFVSFAGLDGIYITSVASEENAETIGLNLIELGKLKGRPPLEATFDLLMEETNEVGMIDYYGFEEHLKVFAQREEMNVCTDGLLGGKPHPRAYGSFPKFIYQYVVKEQILTIEEAIYKCSGKPADVFRIKERGKIVKDYFADLVLFDMDKIKDLGTYLDPIQFPEGIEMVMVNGLIVYDGKDCYDNGSGVCLYLNDTKKS